ncbi:hypothetical protein D9619_009445 [Psilocybe cf. subviscida]|uniref:Uncharacterized protein n=1 Tax=Psilocybe cf. subviscida TaxID=2480587 RepID=A0A8H5FAF7_9AGAR|nr:hypothetical protein D9619_009445 [Psilocybe cf. subviscida]
MQNVVRNLSYKLASRRPGHDTEAGSMAGTTINSSSHFVGHHQNSSANIHPSAGAMAPAYRAPARGVVPSSGMRGALYTNNMRLIVEYREPMHKERMQYDSSNPNEPQVCFQLPLPTEFKPGALISMFILGEPVCAIVQEVSPDDYADDGEGHDGPRISTGKVEWEHGEPYVDGENVRGGDVQHTQDDQDTRLAAHAPPTEPVQPITITPLSPNRKTHKTTPGSNSFLPRKDLASRKPSIISWLKGPISFFRRTRVPGPNGRYRENVVVYPDFQRASLAEGGVERMLLGVDGRPVEGGGHEGVGLDEHEHARGNPYGDDVISPPLSSSPDGNASLLTLAAQRILQQDDARIESWAEKHPHRSFPPIPSPAPRYPTFSAVYGGDVRLPSRSPSASPTPQQDMDPEPSISSRFKESFSTLRIKYSDSPPPQSLQDPRLSHSNSVQRTSGIASPIPSPAVSIPRHPGAAQATLQRRDTQTSRWSSRRSEETVQLQPVRRHPSNSNSAPHRSSHRRDTSFDAAARARAQEEADLRALQKHLPSPVAPPAIYTRQRSLSASGIRNFIGNALSRISNTNMSPTATRDPRPRASSMSETASVAGKKLPEITVGETESWMETFEPFKPRAMQRAPTPPLLSSRGPRSPLPLYRAGSGSSKGQSSEARPRPSPSRQDPKPASPSPSYSPTPAPAYAAHPLFPQMRIRTPYDPPMQTLHSSSPVPERPSANIASMRVPSTFTSMYPHLPSSRHRNVSTLTTDSGASRMTVGGTHTVRQLSRNQSKLKPLPVTPPKVVGDHQDANSGSESEAGYGGTWRSYASTEKTKPTISPHGTVGSRERPVHPPLQAAMAPRHNPEPSSHPEGSQHTRFLPNISGQPPPRAQPAVGGKSASPSPNSNAKDANHPRRLAPVSNPSGARAGYPYDNPPRPYVSPSRPEPPGDHFAPTHSPQASPGRGPSNAMAASPSDSATAGSTLDGYQTAPSIPSISDAFDMSSYRADSRTGAPHGRHDASDDDADSNSGESETVSDGDSDGSNAHDSDTDREVDTTRHTNGSWAIPAGAIDAYGNERAAILSGNARVYIARPRDQPPTRSETRTRPAAQDVFNAAAIATRPTRPDPPRRLPNSPDHPGRF